MKPRIVPLLGLLWEVGRYILLVKVVQLIVNPLQSPEYDFLIFWILSGGLLPVLGLSFVSWRPAYYAPVASLVGAVKLMQVLAGASLILYETGVLPVLLGYLTSGVAALAPVGMFRSLLILLSLMGFLDLLSGLFLLLYRPEKRSRKLRGGESEVPVQFTDYEEG